MLPLGLPLPPGKKKTIHERRQFDRNLGEKRISRERVGKENLLVE